jgi:hypothetical protein
MTPSTFTKVIVYGEVAAVVQFTGDEPPSRQPTKLWETVAPEQVGVPLFGQDSMPVGNILDVVEHRTDGTIRRTWWRLPAPSAAPPGK